MFYPPQLLLLLVASVLLRFNALRQLLGRRRLFVPLLQLDDLLPP